MMGGEVTVLYEELALVFCAAGLRIPFHSCLGEAVKGEVSF